MPTNGESDRELELKLAVPDGAVRGVLDCPVLLLSAPDAKRLHQVTTYYDTPDLALSHAGIALRVRRSNGAHVQTVKADSRAGLAADRFEREWPIEGDRPDPNLLAQTPVAAGLPEHLPLEPVAITEIDRTARLLDLDDGTQVEAAFDSGWIIAGNARVSVKELELELRQGDPVAIYRLALQLHASVPMTIETESKAARGFSLRHGTTPAPSKSAHVALIPDTCGADAFRQIIAAGLDHLLANRSPTVAGDAEGLHQMRVAIRRLRSALVFFRPHLELERYALARFDEELRRIGRVFGEARDWDVFCLDILPATLADNAAGWRDILQEPAQRQRDAAYRAVTAEVAAPAFTSLVLGLAAWTEQGAGQALLVGDHALHRSIARLAPEMLDRLADKVAHRGRHIDGSDRERHALRKSLKKLRYAIDYAAGAYPHKSVRSYLHACAQLQEALGEINDAVAAIGLAERLAEGHPDLTPALGALANILTARRQEAVQDLPRRWQHFRSEPRFWG